jgi:N-glycosylase/DNA lyase
MTGTINVSNFNLAATLECGQAFRWQRAADGWFEGVVGREIWGLRQSGGLLEWETGPTPSPSKEGNPELPSPGGAGPSPRRSGFGHAGGGGSPQIHIAKYLSLDRSLPHIAATFPADDKPLRAAVEKHWGLRVLRQEPWECLASFIASSTKQIVQIRQIVAELSRRFGDPLAGCGRAALLRGLGRGAPRPCRFPTVDAIARASQKELCDCKLGFRAKNLLAAARMIDSGKVDLHTLRAMDYERALEELLKLPGVGEKIANCVLLFSCGFDQAFPVDVWIERALRRLYFPQRKVTARQLRDFARSHFGPYAGWAQQYLFFNERTTARSKRRLNCQ